jgi:hypothetical protein
MASPAVALPNGVPENAHSRDVDMADAQHSTPTKRKRESSINGIAHDAKLQPTSNGDAHPQKSDEAVIRDYLLILEAYVQLSECTPQTHHHYVFSRNSYTDNFPLSLGMILLRRYSNVLCPSRRTQMSQRPNARGLTMAPRNFQSPKRPPGVTILILRPS